MRNYRGLNKDGKWVYGWYVVEGIKTPKPHFIVSKTGKWDEVIPETVGQFTGIKDRNGEEIYEGCKVKADKWEYEVIWQNVGYGLKGIKSGWWRQFHEFQEVEIISDIHQNPELLEQDNGE